MLDFAKQWYPVGIVSIADLKEWVKVGYLEKEGFQEVTGIDYGE